MPKVSVILPNFNHAQYLAKRIESILTQDFRDFELIILDDCSPDESRRVIESYMGDPRIRTIFNEVNSGSTYKQWSLGLKESSGEYVWFAESDDYAAPLFLSTLVDRLDQNPGVGLAVCQSTFVDQHDAVVYTADDWLLLTGQRDGYDLSGWDKDFVMLGREYCAKFMSPWNTIPNGSAVVFRRSALESAGGIATGLQLCGDWMTYVNVLMVSDIAYIARALNYFRSHSNSVRSRSRVDLFYRESQTVVRSIADRLGLDPRRHLSPAYLEPFVQGLLASERDNQQRKVPLSRQWTVLRRSAGLAPGAFVVALRILAKENLAQLASRLGVLGLARQIKRRWVNRN